MKGKSSAMSPKATVAKRRRKHLGSVSAAERRDRKVGLAGDLSDEWLAAVRKARIPARHRHRAH